MKQKSPCSTSWCLSNFAQIFHQKKRKKIEKGKLNTMSMESNEIIKTLSEKRFVMEVYI